MSSVSGSRCGSLPRLIIIFDKVLLAVLLVGGRAVPQRRRRGAHEVLGKGHKDIQHELYLLIQAYAQAAPQIILQLYHMLIQDLFRNYETCK